MVGIPTVQWLAFQRYNGWIVPQFQWLRNMPPKAKIGWPEKGTGYSTPIGTHVPTVVSLDPTCIGAKFIDRQLPPGIVRAAQ